MATVTDELRKLINVGPKTIGWLHEAGIHSREDLERLGSIEVYKRLKELHPYKVTLNALWGLEAALLNISYKMLPPEVKEELLRQLGTPS
jgi:DNA transformation protein and related proteins